MAKTTMMRSAQRAAPAASARPVGVAASVQPRSCRRAVAAQAGASSEAAMGRRQLVLSTIGAVSLAPAVAPGLAIAAKAPKGFNPWEDLSDGYKLFYPFGWQEVAVTGADVVFKDVIEPLESVSVTLTKTDKKDITDFGGVQEVAETLAREVLTAPSQEVKVIASSQRELNGRNYYEFEFTASNPRYTRHQLAVVAAANDKLYVVTTGSGEKRWGKVKDRLQTTIRSFQLLF